MGNKIRKYIQGKSIRAKQRRDKAGIEKVGDLRQSWWSFQAQGTGVFNSIFIQQFKQTPNLKHRDAVHFDRFGRAGLHQEMIQGFMLKESPEVLKVTEDLRLSSALPWWDSKQQQ